MDDIQILNSKFERLKRDYEDMLNNLNAENFESSLADKLSALKGVNTGDETSDTIKDKLGIETISGENTGNETLASIKELLGIVDYSGVTTDATPKEIFIDGVSSNRLICPINSAVGYRIVIMASITGGATYKWVADGFIKNSSGTTMKWGDPVLIQSSTAVTTQAVALSIADAVRGLKLTVTGTSSSTYQWTARLYKN